MDTFWTHLTHRTTLMSVSECSVLVCIYHFFQLDFSGYMLGYQTHYLYSMS